MVVPVRQDTGAYMRFHTVRIKLGLTFRSCFSFGYIYKSMVLLMVDKTISEHANSLTEIGWDYGCLDEL
jgi:hypothetical protein